jgi:hypothetical protein
MCYRSEEFSRLLGWLVWFAIPLGFLLWRAISLAKKGWQGEKALTFAQEGLLLATWFYFAENFVFFRFPWPWTTWTYRTPSAIIFTVCALSLSAAALMYGRRPSGINA